MAAVTEIRHGGPPAEWRAPARRVDPIRSPLPRAGRQWQRPLPETGVPRGRERHMGRVTALIETEPTPTRWWRFGSWLLVSLR